MRRIREDSSKNADAFFSSSWLESQSERKKSMALAFIDICDVM
jgi:hypothetical protein